MANDSETSLVVRKEIDDRINKQKLFYGALYFKEIKTQVEYEILNKVWSSITHHVMIDPVINGKIIQVKEQLSIDFNAQ
jgi:hypothetical protein